MIDPEVIQLRIHRFHFLKTWPEYYRAVVTGKKTFELRRNDRNYRAGDIVILREYDPASGQFTGDEISFRISYVTDFRDALKTGYVAFGLQAIRKAK